MSHATDFRNFIQTQASAKPPSLPPDGYTGSPHKHHGISVPAIRAFIREWTASHKQLPYDEFIATLTDLYNGESIEEKIFAATLLTKYTKLRQQLTLSQLDSWLDQLVGWAEVDSTCQSTFTAKELTAKWSEWQPFLRKLSRDQNINKRRASIVLLNKSLRESDDPRFINLALELVDVLKSEKDKLITKAISWVLREGIKYHRATIEQYIEANRTILPKIALREVTTKLTTGKK
jgi:3-methyladenine DNA glycosylase AlkD